MTPDPGASGGDEQDQSEVFDEDNQTLADAGAATTEFRTFEEIADVYDVTSAVGDADDDAARISEDMDDAEIIEAETDAVMADLEDDELALRMPEALDQDELRTRSTASADEAPLVYAGDLDDIADDQADATGLEATRLSDRQVADLGYAEGSASDGSPVEPTRFRILLRDGLWALERDGEHLHAYGQVSRAVHEASELARELRSTGQPALVFLQPADGKVIEVTDDEPSPAPAEESSAVVGDRGGSA